MTKSQIDGQKFAELLLMKFPELRPEIQESKDLAHLQMMELMLFTVRASVGIGQLLKHAYDLLMYFFALETRNSRTQFTCRT